MKHVFVFDEDRCCACSSLYDGCMDQNDIDLSAGEACYRKTYDNEVELADGSIYCAYLSAACMHCDDAPCITACPVGCLSKDLRLASQSMTTPTASAAKAAHWPAPLARPVSARRTGKW